MTDTGIAYIEIYIYIYIYKYRYIYIHIYIHIYIYIYHSQGTARGDRESGGLYIYIYIYMHVYTYCHHVVVWDLPEGDALAISLGFKFS